MRYDFDDDKLDISCPGDSTPPIGDIKATSLVGMSGPMQTVDCIFHLLTIDCNTFLRQKNAKKVKYISAFVL